MPGSSSAFTNVVDGTSEQTAATESDGSIGSEDESSALRKRDKARSFARRAKAKTKELFSSDDKHAVHGEEPSQKKLIDEISSDPAFNPALILNHSPPKLAKGEKPTVKSELKSAVNTIAHPRQTIQAKVTRKAAGKISRAQRPFLSAEQDRNLLEAHDELDKIASSRSSPYAQTPPESGAEASGDEGAARRKIEELEHHRSSLQVAWTLGKHVNRVKIVQAKVPPHLPRDHFFETESSGERGRFQWERWLGYEALYYTRGFTARYIDDFEELTFDIEDLSRIIERLVLISEPWQAWFMSVRQVYLWEDPKRTGKWFMLFWVLWYTEHIMGFVYAWIVYSVIRNKYHPSSVESVRRSMKRGIDREVNAQAWSEIVERHGRQNWIEPLLDELGPYIQLQLGDLADLLEVLANFYRWKAPWKTGETVFFFFCCLLITLFTDMAFCMKIVWFVAGGWFFLCFPIASRYPKYRYLMDPGKWILWDIPTNAEWSIEFLQDKAKKQHKEMNRRAHVSDLVLPPDDATSSSDEDSHPSLPQHAPMAQDQSRCETPVFKFRAFQSRHRGHIHVDDTGIRFSSRGAQHWSIPYERLMEMSKAKPDNAIKTATLGIAGSGLQFVGKDALGKLIHQTVTVKNDQRDEIFNIILGWSGLTWRAVRMNRPREKRAEGKKRHPGAVG
jgi:hypothetical protein